MPAEPVRRPLSDDDAAAVIGLLAVLEGELLVGSVDPVLARLVRDRFAAAGLLQADDEIPKLRRALAELNQRVRFAHGEYAAAPPPEGPVHHLVAFDSQGSATEFQEAATSLWPGARALVLTGDQAQWIVPVTDEALPLTDEFADHREAVERLARRLGGGYGGWEG